MAPSKTPTTWDDEESDSGESSSQSSPQIVARRSKFEDEEDEDSDVIDSWDAAEDSEVEREKAKKAAEATAKAELEAKANHKSKSERIEQRRQENLRKRLELDGEDSDEEETEAEKRARLRESEKASDMMHAEDLFGGVGGVPASRGAVKPVTIQEGSDPADAVDLSAMKIFNPSTLQDFNKMREVLVPLIIKSAKKPQFESFMKEFSKQLVQSMNSDQVKKVASGLTTISNEKMREEKAAEKGGKKSKAAKTKISLSAGRDIANKVDTTLYDDGLDDGDFM